MSGIVGVAEASVNSGPAEVRCEENFVEGFLEENFWFFQCSLDTPLEMFGFLRILSVLVVLFDMFI